MNKIAAEFSEFVLFSEEEARALDARVVMREARGKPVPYVTCLVRDKEVQLKPEERTRQLWLAHLIDKLGYARSRIAIEYPITFGAIVPSGPTSWSSTLTAPPSPTSSSR